MDNPAEFSLADLYLAYRKAKAEAFHEHTHFHALAFTHYEASLLRRLQRLRRLLNGPHERWTNASFVGGFLYAPKAVHDFPGTETGDSQVRVIDPNEEWKNQFEQSGRKRAKADFRLVISPTVDFQIVSALWILRVGHILDGRLSANCYGNRLRRIYGVTPSGLRHDRAPNLDCLGLFPPYFSAYRKWRENGLEAMKAGLRAGKRIFAITMDLRRFYHNVSPQFLTRPLFWEAIGATLPTEFGEFNAHFVTAIDNWYRETPDFFDRPEGALPVGLSASKVIANVLLRDFDAAIAAKLTPLYYGRYVDDVFLVLEKKGQPHDLLKAIGTDLRPMLSHSNEGGSEGPSLRLRLPYAKDADLLFVGSKQKIFDLSNDYGLDLVEHIGEQIRLQSSEHRLLPELPESDTEMATRGLLATPDATLEADALRKADVVSIRRLGFSLLLRDVEAYARELLPSAWKPLRNRFYQLVPRYLLTPRGLFDYFGYIHRVFALMIACSDFEEATLFLSRFASASDELRATTTSGKDDKYKFERCLGYYATAFQQAALQASTVDRFGKWSELARIVKAIESVGQVSSLSAKPGELRDQSRQMLLSDWGRRPYKDFWFFSQKLDAHSPIVPQDLSVRKLIRLAKIRRFRREAELRRPYWPALAFPTRPLRIDEIGLVAPKVFRDSNLFRDMVMALRGARVSSRDNIGFAQERGSDFDVPHFYVPDYPRKRTHVAVTSVGTTDLQWENAARRRPDLSSKRYRNLRRLINRILRDRPRTQYIAYPECSLPLRWALPIATKLAQNRISFLSGIEYRYDRRLKRLRNDCMISLTTNWPGYPSNVIRLQPKLSPAHTERARLQSLKAPPLYEPVGAQTRVPVYVHSDLYFAALLCSDLTNIATRHSFQGYIDALFVLEWNRDIETFSFLVEATSHDLHAFIVQINNRQYGDSRIRAPYRDSFSRDLVRVKGGLGDYYVLSALEQRSLRRFHVDGGRSTMFKPLPIGFTVSEQRQSSLS